MFIEPQTIKKYSYYINNRVNNEIQSIGLSATEKAFCLYCSAIGTLVPQVYTHQFSIDKQQDKLLEYAVKTACNMLAEYAKQFLPNTKSDYLELSYTTQDFMKANPNAKNISNFMGGVVYSELAQIGYRLWNEPQDFNNLSGDLTAHNSPYYPDYIADAISRKIRKCQVIK